MTRFRETTAFLCPLLLIAFPLLSVFRQNQSELEPSVLWAPLAVSLAAAAALFLVFVVVSRAAAKAGLLASLVVFAFFYFWLVSDRGSWLVVPWLALSLAGLAAVLRTRRDLANAMLIVGVGVAVMTLPTVVRIAAYHANHPSLSASDSRLWPTALAKPVVRGDRRLPDIYVIVPDDYARADVLAKYFHYDASAFVKQLQQRGFVIAEQSRSPYSDSESNIAALLNMDYLTSFPRILGTRSQDVRPVKRVMEDNRAARLLKPLGYHYVHVDTDEVTFAGANPGISRFGPPDGFANLWMRKSVLSVVGGPLGFNQRATNARFRKSIRSQFARLSAVTRDRAPKFVVFHTLLPHDPYVFRADGRSVTFPGHTDADLATRTGRAYYVQQLRFVDSRILDSVDQILAHSAKPPVVVISSDEGFQANPQPFGEAAMEDIRVKGLSAFYLPGLGPTGLPQPPNTVNSLRFVLNRYLGTQYPMLESHSYAEGDLPYQGKPINGM